MTDPYQSVEQVPTNGRDPMAGQPWWIKAIFFIGVPSAIALGLVWSDRVQLSQTVRLNGDLLRTIQAEAREHDLRVVAKFQELASQSYETNRILMATCVNEAKTQESRERCVGRR